MTRVLYTGMLLVALMGALSMMSIACGTRVENSGRPPDSMLGPTDSGPVDSHPVANRIPPAPDAEINDFAEEDLNIDYDVSGVVDKVRTHYYVGIQKCYRDALKANPALAGRVEITIKIGASGNVTDAEVEGFDRGMDACIRSEAMQWVFDNPAKAKVGVSFAYSFKPKK